MSDEYTCPYCGGELIHVVSGWATETYTVEEDGRLTDPEFAFETSVEMRFECIKCGEDDIPLRAVMEGDEWVARPLQ